MTSLAMPPSTAPRSQASGVLDLLLRQRSLQPFLPQGQVPENLANTCRTLRAHRHPKWADGGLAHKTHVLARMLAEAGDNVDDLFVGLLHTHSVASLGSVHGALADSRDVVWMADAWRKGPTPHARPLRVEAGRRRACLAYLWAVKTGGTVAQGLVAVDAARKTDWVRLVALLDADAKMVLQFCASLGAGAAMGAATWSAAAGAVKAVKLGTVLGSAKGLGLYFLALGTGVTTLAFVGTGAAIASFTLADMAPEHKELCTGAYGKDALFCELLVGRRHIRGRGK